MVTRMRSLGLIAAIILAGLAMGCGENPEPDPSPPVNTTKVIPGVNAPLTGTAKPRPKREKPKPSLNLEAMQADLDEEVEIHR